MNQLSQVVASQRAEIEALSVKASNLGSQQQQGTTSGRTAELEAKLKLYRDILNLSNRFYTRQR